MSKMCTLRKQIPPVRTLLRSITNERKKLEDIFRWNSLYTVVVILERMKES